MKLTWKREPFYGGCAYYSNEGNYTIFGYYSPSNPLELEDDCKKWIVPKIGSDIFFKTPEEAMDAAQEDFDWDFTK